MNGFNDRRPPEAVPKVNLRSKAALEDHMGTHHGRSVGEYSHRELREIHQEAHTDPFSVIAKPHAHENPRYLDLPDDEY